MKRASHLALAVALLLAVMMFAGQAAAGWQLLVDVPRLRIQTELDQRQLSHAAVTSAASYVGGSLIIDGQDVAPDLRLLRIKLRGHAPDGVAQPKMSYKLRLPKKQALFGLPAGRSWILLARFEDPSLLGNMLALKMAHLLQLPGAPELVPVELTLNNRYMGVYWLGSYKALSAEHLTRGRNRLLLELGPVAPVAAEPQRKAHYQFRTARFGLPVQVHQPRLHKAAPAQADARFDAIAAELAQVEHRLLDEDLTAALDQLFDRTALVRLLLLSQFTRDARINPPQGLYLYRRTDGRFGFTVRWAMSSAYGGGQGEDYFVRDVEQDVLAGEQPGTRFFRHLLEDPELRKQLKREWRQFRQHGLGPLRAFISDYIDLLEHSGAYQRDFRRWQRPQDASRMQKRKSLRAYEKDLNLWLDQRAGHMDALLKGWKKPA